MHLSSGQESSVCFVPFSTLLVLWATWKELKEQARFMACPVGSESSVSLVPFLTLLVLWASWKELTKNKHVLWLVRWASESSVSLVPFLTLLVLWATWKELKEQVCFMAVQKNVQRNHVLNVYLAFGRVQTPTHTCPTDKTCGHRVFHTLTLQKQKFGK